MPNMAGFAAHHVHKAELLRSPFTLWNAASRITKVRKPPKTAKGRGLYFSSNEPHKTSEETYPEQKYRYCLSYKSRQCLQSPHVCLAMRHSVWCGLFLHAINHNHKSSGALQSFIKMLFLKAWVCVPYRVATPPNHVVFFIMY